MQNNFLSFPEYLVAGQVSQALSEDLNHTPDWTAQLIAADTLASAYIKTNQDMVLCGQQWASQAFKLCAVDAQIEWQAQEGQLLEADQKLCIISGNARGLLTAERTALNFLQTLSATASITRTYVELVKDLPVKIMDTRKTIPGMRLAQKYAVRVGGGSNQRIGLFDGVLIKENHILAHGGIAEVLAYAFKITPAQIPIQIEVENLSELELAIKHGAKLVLLDNMTVAEIRQAVQLADGSGVTLEISGNVNLATLREYATTGVARISIGSLSKNLQACDLSMRFI